LLWTIEIVVWSMRRLLRAGATGSAGIDSAELQGASGAGNAAVGRRGGGDGGSAVHPRRKLVFRGG
jgi:hypothetical protein